MRSRRTRPPSAVTPPSARCAWGPGSRARVQGEGPGPGVRARGQRPGARGQGPGARVRGQGPGLGSEMCSCARCAWGVQGQGTSHIPHPTSYILHPTSHIPHPTSYILHPTSYILHPEIPKEVFQITIVASGIPENNFQIKIMEYWGSQKCFSNEIIGVAGIFENGLQAKRELLGFPQRLVG